MKLAFSTLGCPEWSIETIAENATAFGIDCVELRGGPHGHVSPQLSADQRRAVRRVFDDAGVKICCVTAYSILSSSEKARGSEQMDDMRRYVELSHDLGSPNVRTFFGVFPWYVYRARVYDHAAEMLNTVAAELDSVRVLVETHDSMSAAEDLEPLLARVDSPLIGVLWDMAHTNRAGEPLERSWEILGPRVHHVHVKDEYPIEPRKLEHRLPGDGVVPLEQVRHLLQANGFEGSVCLEWERAHHPEMPPLEVALPAFTRVFRGGSSES